MLPLTELDEPDKDPNRTTYYPRFVARIADMRDIASIKGMSGGPIFGLAERAGKLRYWVVAVQSRWDKDRRIVYGCPLQVFAKMFSDAINEWCEEHREKDG